MGLLGELPSCSVEAVCWLAKLAALGYLQEKFTIQHTLRYVTTSQFHFFDSRVPPPFPVRFPSALSWFLSAPAHAKIREVKSATVQGPVVKAFMTLVKRRLKLREAVKDALVLVFSGRAGPNCFTLLLSTVAPCSHRSTYMFTLSYRHWQNRDGAGSAPPDARA